MKRTTFITLFFLLASICLEAQTFDTFSLYFEDADGNKDTLRIDRLEGEGTFDIDEDLGEVNLKEKPLNGFDVRFFRFESWNTSNTYHLGWFCDHEDGDVSAANNLGIKEYIYETKQLIHPKFTCVENRRGIEEKFFIPKGAAFPVTISWDRELLQDNCNFTSIITELMPVRWEREQEFNLGWCSDKINYPSINLLDSSSVTLFTPNFQTMERLNTSLVHVYFLKISNSPKDVPVNTFDVQESRVSVYPNPSTGDFSIAGASIGDKIEVYDIHGRLVKEEAYSTRPLHITQKGVLFILVYLEEGVVKKKVVCY